VRGVGFMVVFRAPNLYSRNPLQLLLQPIERERGLPGYMVEREEERRYLKY
jgi:hypothetical protein